MDGHLPNFPQLRSAQGRRNCGDIMPRSFSRFKQGCCIFAAQDAQQRDCQADGHTRSYFSQQDIYIVSIYI